MMAWGSTSGYNQLIVEEGIEDKLKMLPEDKLCIVAGNTKSIWPIMKELLGKSKNPFDDYSKKIS